MRLKTLGLAAALAVGGIGAGAAPALAQATGGNLCTAGTSVQYPLSGCGLTISPTSGLPGTQVTVRGSGFAGISAVSLEFRSQPTTVGSVGTDSGGTFTTTIVIPRDASPGVHTIAAVGRNPNGFNGELTAQFTVLSRPSGLPSQPGTPVQSGNLVRTGGGSTVPLALAGFGLVAMGAAAVRVARGRRRAIA